MKDIPTVVNGSLNFDPNQQVWPTINNVTPIASFVEFDGSNCLDLAKEQIAKNGFRISGYNDAGQTFKVCSEHTGVNKEAAKDGVSYLISALQRGIPVIVGVDYKASNFRNGNPDGSTDHFVVIVGSGSDANGNYFTFYDNATNHANKGANPNNKLYYNPATGKIIGNTAVTYSNGMRLPGYTVTQIRKSK